MRFYKKKGEILKFLLVAEDFFTKKFILLSVLPSVFSIIIFGFLIFFGGSEIYQNLIQNPEIIAPNGSLLAKILSNDMVQFIIVVLLGTAGVLLVLVLSLIVATLISGFLTPIVTNFVNNKYYKFDLSNLPTLFFVLKKMFFVFLKFILILIAILPFLFIPLVNLVALNIPFFYLYYKFMLIDVASNSLNSREFNIFLESSGNFKYYCLLFYCISLIPLVGLLFQLFFVMFLTHITYENFKTRV